MQDVPCREGRTLSLAGGRFHDVAYVEWGDPSSPRVAVCVHGLTRQGRDFDLLAQSLARLGYRVVCPDVAGRGRSGRRGQHGRSGCGDRRGRLSRGEGRKRGSQDGEKKSGAHEPTPRLRNAPAAA